MPGKLRARPALMSTLPFLLVPANGAWASATADEFVHCHEMVSASLLQCMIRTPGHVERDCWRQAEQLNTACFVRVQAPHRVDKQRIAEERHARETALKERASREGDKNVE